jgi:hypothetical protein
MSSDPPGPDGERAFAKMQRDLPRVTPREDLFDRIAASRPGRADDEQVVATPVARPPRRFRRPPFAIPAGVALVALVVALVIAVAVSGDPPPAANGALVGHGSSGVHGRVDVFDPSGSDGRVVVHLRGLGGGEEGSPPRATTTRSGCCARGCAR